MKFLSNIFNTLISGSLVLAVAFPAVAASDVAQPSSSDRISGSDNSDRTGHASVADIFAIGKSSDNRGQLSRSVAFASVGFSARWLRGPLSHEKDDDLFTIDGSSNVLFGGSFALETPISASNAANDRTFVAHARIGYNAGIVSVRRSGIENYDYRLDYHVVPLSVSLGLNQPYAVLGKPGIVSGRIGAELALISQIGRGELDTVSSIRYAESAELVYHLTSLPSGPFAGVAWIGPLSRAASQAIVATIGTQTDLF